jgi:hypothetical protein
MKSFLKNYKKKIATAFLVVAVVAIGTSQASILGSAADYAVLAGSAVTNVGSSTVTGDIGVWAGSSITGYPLITHTGVLHVTDTDAEDAQTDLTTAFNGLAAMTYTSDLTGQDLGGLTLTSGVYKFTDLAQLTGTLKLDAEGNNNAFWVFQIGKSLTTGTSSAVQLINPGSNNGFDVGVFWQVGSSATLGTTTAFEGNILADQSITLITGATISNGRALARIAEVTLGTNVISNVCPLPNGGPGFSGGLKFDTDGKTIVPVVPEPATLCLLGLGGLLLGRSRKFNKK